jgi:Mrp family chromosome partitioning ATPase
MSEENCNHECDSCGAENCSSRGKIEKLKTHDLTSFKKIIAIISGKGGVGKSLVTALLAVGLVNQGHKVAILDADVTGPSMPEAFGLNGYQAVGDENGIYPGKTKNGLEVISANNLLDNPTAPLVWRGPMISQLVGQLYSQVVFGEMEFLLIDMPPGTGDVPLTVFQQIPIDGVVVVSSPQDLVSLVVEKSINMAKMMDVKVLGLVENMSYVLCPKCGEHIKVFGDKNAVEVAKKFEVALLDELPLDPALAKLVDEGKIESYKGPYLANAIKAIEKM